MDAVPEFRMGKDKALEAFSAAHPGERIFMRGHAGGRIFYARSLQRGYLRIEQEADGVHLLDVYELVKEAGLLEQGVDTLVDMSAFIGSFDWDALAKISAMLPAHPNQRKKAAYLFNDKANVLLLKVLNVMFPYLEHKVFETEAEARAWLGWK